MSRSTIPVRGGARSVVDAVSQGLSERLFSFVACAPRADLVLEHRRSSYVRAHSQTKEVYSSLGAERFLDFLLDFGAKLPSGLSHRQASSGTVSHHQPLSAIVCHRQP